MSSLSNSIDLSLVFTIFQEINSFKKREAFKEIKELVFLSYYKDFKLIFCSTCAFALITTAFKSHLLKHLKLFPKIERESIIHQALLIFNNLEISDIKESLDLIILFSKLFILPAFKELEIKDLFLYNLSSNYSTILSSEYSIKRHIREIHNNINSNNLSYKVIKGQILEINKFFFEIKLNNSINLEEFNKSGSNSPIIDPLKEAKEAFKANFLKKEEDYLEELNSFNLDVKKKLSFFQIKTHYIEYINKYNIKDLVNLVKLLKKEEKLLEILIINLKEVLYLSLNKAIFLNKVHLNVLNSFEPNKIKNRGFKILLNNNNRIKYFNFFNIFIIYKVLLKLIDFKL